MTVENVDTKNVKVGVIGMGRIGLVHLEAITKAPGVTPVLVSNPTISKAEAGESLLCFLAFAFSGWTNVSSSLTKDDFRGYMEWELAASFRFFA